ncbi:MAG: extracellular solute-binding protein [Rhodobacteraceae bacterium]|nr:extracellular solute-binding protein [Paracoccaceae bacterium]
MRIDRRKFIQSSTAAATLAGAPVLSAAPAFAEWSGGGVRSHGESLLGALKYGPDFKHFDYVNPDAPKGGTAKLSVGTPYDSFNPFNAKGQAASGVSTLVYESLMTPPMDEGSTHYGLLAEWMEFTKGGDWAAFRLRDGARWHDGEPVTVADVQKSFELLTTQGNPLYRYYYGDVSEVIDEGDRIVLFKFSTTENRELPHILGQLNVFPAHFWESRAFDQPTLESPLGSGPYRISRFEEGRFVEMSRVEDYWGADLPVRVGSNNFETLRFEHFLDRDTAFEAFKKGDVDYWEENSAQRWAERFDFPALRKGHVVKDEPKLEGPKTIQSFAFNLRRPQFADRRVRAALGLAFDFEWSNKAVFFDQYARPYSYFQGSEGLMALGVPEGDELALLEPYRDQLPAELFEKPFKNLETDGSGSNRRGLRRARKLLEEAGWTIQDQRLVNAEGTPLTLEFLLTQASSQEKVVQPFLDNLAKLGVEATLRSVDSAQYVRRRRSYDFDMILAGVANSESPGNEQREFWGSKAANVEGSRNVSGVDNPIVNSLIEVIINAPERSALEAASRALDRVLLWEHYMISELYTPYERVAYWDRFGHPEPYPPRAVGFPNVWWWDAEKAAKI